MTYTAWWLERWCGPCWRGECDDCRVDESCEHACPWLTDVEETP